MPNKKLREYHGVTKRKTDIKYVHFKNKAKEITKILDYVNGIQWYVHWTNANVICIGLSNRPTSNPNVMHWYIQWTNLSNCLSHKLIKFCTRLRFAFVRTLMFEAANFLEIKIITFPGFTQLQSTANWNPKRFETLDEKNESINWLKYKEHISIKLFEISFISRIAKISIEWNLKFRYGSNFIRYYHFTISWTVQHQSWFILRHLNFDATFWSIRETPTIFHYSEQNF